LVKGREEALKKATVLCGLLSLATAHSAAASETKPIHITCETVRAYVAAVGVEQAREVALAHGMTAWQERLAKRCLGG
jgi:hypothetical protein